MKRASWHQLSALKALPAGLSPAFSMALWLVAFNVSSSHAQGLNASQALFFSDSRVAWGTTLPGWKVGADCRTVSGSMCDASGMITSITLPLSLAGSIPSSISVLTALKELDLSYNNFSGPIPASLGKLHRLQYIALSSNSLMGSIPNSISTLTSLVFLDLSTNSLTGSIPDSISALTALAHLGLSYNQLTGSLPAWLGNLPHLQVLYTDGTNLTCPANTRSCSQTHYALLPNTSFCQYCASFCFACRQSTGPTSSNRSSNSNSSSSSNNSSSSRSSSSNSSSSSGSDSSSPAASGGGGGVPVGAIVGIAVAAVVVLLLLLAAVLLCFRQQTKRNLKGMGTSLAASHCTEFSLDEVLKATNDWSQDNLLGSGAFGDVYKGVSPRDGTTEWAVKRAKLMDSDFQREVQQMANKNHPNIVRLLGFAVGGDLRTRPEHILIYEFVPNGDLHKWIDPEAPSPLSLQQRLDIFIGAARGFKYLHSFGVVHRDIKPANILITNHIQAKIADFGLLREGEDTAVGEGTTAGKGTTQVMGTPGYVDPVYSKTSQTTTASDVYSFGVLMLVVLTGRPLFSESAGETKHILLIASECLASGDSESLRDPRMDTSPKDAVLRVAELAVSCTVERTASRPSMAHIATQLQAVREEVAGKEELGAATKVDAQVQEMKNAVANVLSLDAEIDLIAQQFS